MSRNHPRAAGASGTDRAPHLRLLAVCLLLVLLGAALFIPDASAETKKQQQAYKPLDAETLFAEAERDLAALTDLRKARALTLSDGKDADVNAAGTWILDGEASDMTVRVRAPKDAAVVLLLRGVRIDNRDRPCIEVESAGRVYLVTTGDSTLRVSGKFRKTDGAKVNAALYSQTELTLAGEARLSIESSKNGIVCGDKLRILKGDYAITAGSKAIAADNAIWIAGGSYRLKADSDGLHAENDNDSMQGSIYICGGRFDIDASDDGIHGQALVQIDGGRFSIQADEGVEATWALVNGGVLDIRAIGDGVNAGHKSDAYRPRIEINGGRLSIRMDGPDPDGLDSNADMVITGGTVSITGAGIDYDGELSWTGGTVILEGKTVSEIPNTSTHHLA